MADEVVYEDLPGGVIQWRKKVTDEHTITFRAIDVRKTSTGVHAEILIGLDRTPLASDIFNVGRHPDRTRLANAAYKLITDGALGSYTADVLNNDLMRFCRGLWRHQTSLAVGMMVSGSDDPHTPTFLLEPYVLTDGGTIIFAAPGQGKSWIALLMAVAIDAGIDTLWPVRQGRVLFINLERSTHSIQQRLGMVNGAFGLPLDRQLLMINARGKSLRQVWEGAKRTVDDRGVDVVVLDSLSRGGFGNLNDNDAANDAMDGLNGFGCAWVTLAHTAREDTSHVFGSQMFDAAADLTVQLISQQKPDGTLGIGLKGTKGNDVPPPPLKTLALEFSRERGLQVVRPAARLEFPEVIDAAQERSFDERVEDQLRVFGMQTQSELAKDLQRSATTISKALRRLEKAGKVGVVKQEGRAIYWGVLTERDDGEEGPEDLERPEAERVQEEDPLDAAFEPPPEQQPPLEEPQA